MTKIPTPHYTLIETSKGRDPAIVVVNSALRTFQHRALFPWHLSVNISCQLLGDKGMPTPEENQILYSLEDEISKKISADGNAVFLARITCQGQRQLLYRVHDPEVANDQLQLLASAPNPLRSWEYRMEEDSEWKIPQPELRLLEHDPKFN